MGGMKQSKNSKRASTLGRRVFFQADKPRDLRKVGRVIDLMKRLDTPFYLYDSVPMKNRKRNLIRAWKCGFRWVYKVWSKGGVDDL